MNRKPEVVCGPGNYPAIAHTYLSGGGGLSSTTADYAKFLQMILLKGKYKEKQIISPTTVAMMLTNQLGNTVGTTPWPPMPADFQFGLGFALETERNDYLQPLHQGSFSWEGAVATYYWVDPQEDLIALFYTQEFATPIGAITNKYSGTQILRLNNYTFPRA
ncbi:serine hydrolase [Paraflavitalea speifideaquila]|uniref:serine hydrolase n=1 Tax=Paraflavitalea speifideaquila TaxID=3076558 RepID=UPI0028E57D7C|nr:serine hydrolase [Paraflavitalea speifideiaquila]